MTIVNIQIPFQDGLTGLVEVPVDVPAAPSDTWTRTGTIVHETTPTDQVVIGAAAPVGAAPLEVQQALTQFFQVGSADAFARRQLWSTLLNSILRLGADAADGDAFSADSEGIVVYHPTGDQMGRMKADRFGLTRASDANLYYFRVDQAALFYRADPPAGVVWFHVDRATGACSLRGMPKLEEAANGIAGVAVLGGAGAVVVANTRVSATTRFVLTAQDGGAPLTGALQQTARVAGASFTIASSAGVGDAGVQVYYQLHEPA
jgi:hypothetical protein